MKLSHRAATGLLLLCFRGIFFTQESTASVNRQSLEDWGRDSVARAIQHLWENISPEGSLPGTLIASPSRHHPDYDYHWIRDGSLGMKTLIRLYHSQAGASERAYILSTLRDFALLSRHHQQSNAPAGFGEPKFHTDGRPYTGPWGRPQNDGPALRALVLTEFAEILLAKGEETWVRQILYDGHFPSESVIKADLEYTAANWRNTDFDLWEEIRGEHFFTRMIQINALVRGSQLALRLGDAGAASWYRKQARYITNSLENFRDQESGYIRATVNRTGGIDYKSGLDASVLLAVLLDQHVGGNFSVTGSGVRATIQALEEAFSSVYSINQPERSLPGLAVGRYPEDRYDGYETGKRGNPWFILTLGLGEVRYQQAARICQEEGPGSHEGLSLLEKGDAQLQRVRIHQGEDYSMAEQFNRDHGLMQGARHLSWSYTSLINAWLSRAEALEACDPGRSLLKFQGASE